VKATDERDVCGGTVPISYTTITRKGRQAVDAGVIEERLVSFFVNGQELLTSMATPCQQDAHALGFLANEGIIHSMDDVRTVHVCPGSSCVDVWLAYADFEPPGRVIVTSGCGGGVTFNDPSTTFEPLKSEMRVTPERLWEMMDQLHKSAVLYNRAGGVHASGLGDGKQLLLTAEDVGRHNTLDKLRGLALQANIDTRDCVILTTGRISSEMIGKARRMGVPIVCSHTSPTSLSIGLADKWNITLIGYLRRNSMNLYTHPERIQPEETVASPDGRQRRTPNV
jgi:FdhD protein